MADEVSTSTRPKGWLVVRSGPLAGTRYALAEGITRIGRSPENDVVIQGPNAAIVSLRHAEITREGSGFRIRDSGSTNGTQVDGERISEAELRAPAVIQLGNNGPEFSFMVEEAAPESSELDRTLVVPRGVLLPQMPAPAGPAEEHDELLSEAVMQARRARAEGYGNQTMTLMRSALDKALRRSRRRLRTWIYALAAALVMVSSYGYWKVLGLRREKTSIDGRIQQIEKRLAGAEQNPEQTDRLLSELATYQNQAESLQKNVLYRIGVREREAFVTHEIRELLAEFGAEAYSIPPEFVERVNHYIQQYQGPDRPLMERALNQLSGKIEAMRRVLEQENLPPDLAYVPLVESALAPDETSAAGAAGPWQLTAATAKAYGLRVDSEVDQRFELRPATRAACRYLRELILDFGAGSSVMLAMAAYNLGPGKVKQAILKTVHDPIKQRNFWYLYRTRALPEETREYVPKVIAAILIGRNPQRFGF